MKWKQEDGYITTEGPLRASVKTIGYSKSTRYELELSAHGTFDTEEEAKKFGEEQLQIAKRAFILSLIVKCSEDSYMFGKDVMQIIGGYDSNDEWRVYGYGFVVLFEGTLEECKNYIVECF
jgi:hypothetical protein